ncbi:hypothetical protein QQG55_9995 [Brugia pahangi]
MCQQHYLRGYRACYKQYWYLSFLWFFQIKLRLIIMASFYFSSLVSDDLLHPCRQYCLLRRAKIAAGSIKPFITREGLLFCVVAGKSIGKKKLKKDQEMITVDEIGTLAKSLRNLSFSEIAITK